MNERCDRTREQIEGIVNGIYNQTEEPSQRQLQMLDLILEVMLDIRETMYRIERDKSSKWGSKL